MLETHGLFLWLINTCMKIAEVTNTLKTYIATVRVNGAAHKTSIKADSADLREAGAGQSLDAGQQQVKALADQARRLAQQKRQLQARQGMARAQERLRQASKQAN
jgi:hypothetical protein